MPLSVEEFHIGQLYSIIEASKNETGGGEGVEILENEPFSDYPLFGSYDSGQFTHKIYHLKSKAPGYIRKIAPQGSLVIHEKSWNAYPYCRTEITNPDFMGENFFVRIDSFYLDDRGTTENAHELSDDILAKRRVVSINIANDKEFLKKVDVKPETSPHLFVSANTGRGRLDVNSWREECEPVMCAYKVVTVHFKWFGLQTVVEKFAHNFYPRLFSKFHREVFCWIDQWYGLSIDNIRQLEREAQEELEEARINGKKRGMDATN